MEKIVFSFIILCFVITAAGYGGVPTVPSTSESEYFLSGDFVLIQVKYPKSNILFIAGEENENTIVKIIKNI